jgi:hypothetical protein
MKFSHFSLIFGIATFAFPALACPPDGEPIDKVAPPEKVEKQEETSDATNKPKMLNGLRILIAGGGYSPSGNQISLESNVKYFRKVMEMLDLRKAETRTLFADGRDKGRDLQYADPAFRIPEANGILAELVGSTRGLGHQYRSNELNSDGSALLADLDKWFDSTAKKPGKEALIYFTGHGGKGDKKTPDNTTAHLWSGQKIKVRDFVKRLDKLPKNMPVTLVMVQCYSGGFANVIFKDGDPKKGMSDHARAGFFATVQDRVAAGCTPDIREKNYKEYSTSFWEALCGESRVGDPVDKPDFDGDGRTSYAEAHAHVILTSDTIDVPIKTSGAFLRKFSKTSQPKAKKPEKKSDSNATVTKACDEKIKSEEGEKPKEETEAKKEDGKESKEDWLTVESHFDKILEVASPFDRAVLEGLSKQLGLKGENRAKSASDLTKKLEDGRKAFAEKKKKSDEERKRIKTKLSGQIRKRWPEVGNPYHPMVRRLLRSKESKELFEMVNKEDEWGKYKKAKSESAGLEKKRFELERKKVKCMRFRRVLENVVLEVNLPLVAEKKTLTRYKELCKLEACTLKAIPQEAEED